MGDYSKEQFFKGLTDFCSEEEQKVDVTKTSPGIVDTLLALDNLANESKRQEGKPCYAQLPQYLFERIVQQVMSKEIQLVLTDLFLHQHDLTKDFLELTINYIFEKSNITKEEVCKVAMYGNSKYARCNWKNGTYWSMYFEAAIRHLIQGDTVDKDSDSGVSHIAHAIVNLGILHYYLTNCVGINDLTLDNQ